MLDSLPQSTSPSIRDWEDAGAFLGVALDRYLDLCSSLWTISLREGLHPKDLAARIDSTLQNFHITLDQRLSRSRSVLSRARNRIISPIYRFPEEVLSEIFTHVIFGSLNSSEPNPMRESLVAMYRSLYSLLGVCTVWKNVVLRHKPFWSTIPVIDLDPSPLAFKFNQATKLTLERSGKVDLRLAAIRADQWQGIPNLVSHTSRFRGINITAMAPSAIGSVINPFLKLGSSRRLSELSIRVEQQGTPSNRIPQDYEYIHSLDSSSCNDFNNLLKDLSILRLCGTLVHFEHAMFSSRLVELRIQEVTLGHNAELAKLLKALSSADQLRDLRFISITTFPDRVTAATTTPKASLPGLQHLLIQDVYSNTMRLLLESITSRSHHLTLSLTEKCTQVKRAGRNELETIDVDDLYELWSQVSVNTLLVDSDEADDHWLDSSELEMMMRMMPDLKSLWMNYCDFEREWCDALTRPEKFPNRPEMSLPALENIHLSWARIYDEDGFKNMVGSYSDSLRRMVLGGAAPVDLEGEDGLESLEGGEEIVEWLEANVPEFELTDNGYDPPEFGPPEWQLW